MFIVGYGLMFDEGTVEGEEGRGRGVGWWEEGVLSLGCVGERDATA